MNIDTLIALTEGIATKADKMRVLERNGYARADIARFLGVRYQQVRNTLEGDKRTGYNPEITPKAAAANPLQSHQLRGLTLDDDGVGLIPPDLLTSLHDDNDEQDSVFIILEVPGGLFLCTSEGLISRAASTF